MFYDYPAVQPEIEQGIIGSILEGLHTSGIEDELFADERCLKVFKLIKHIEAKGQKPDLLLLTDYIMKNKIQDKLPGISVIGSWVANATNPAMIEPYLKEMRTAWARRRFMQLGHEISKKAAAGSNEEEIIDYWEAEASRVSKRETRMWDMPTLCKQTIDHLEAIATGRIKPRKTGIAPLDNHIGGFYDGKLIVLAGRPGMGKTALALQIAMNVAKDGVRTGFITLEMPAKELGGRLLSMIAEVEVGRVSKGMTGPEWSRIGIAEATLNKLPLIISEVNECKLGEIKATIRAMAKSKCKLVAIDYLQLIGGGVENRRQEIDEITRGLKLIALETSMPILALSQLSRKCEERDDKRPMLSDLRESGSIEQDADMVLFAFRPGYYKQEESFPGVAEIIIGKNREGALGAVECYFNDKLTRFQEFRNV